MDYFFCCFGTNDDDQSPQSLLIKDPVLSKSSKPVIYRRPFLPLQITRDHSACKDSETSLSGMLLGGNEDTKLNIEAGLVNVTGTFTKTRKLCGKSRDSCPLSEDLENTFTQSVNLEQQAESPMTPTEVAEDWIQEPGRNKYVHFKGKRNEIPSFSSGPESASDLKESTPLPYPTPLKLTDEMQTPGTAFPTTFETLKNRKYHHIRSQYVYPVQNLHQSKSLKVAGSHSNQMTKSLDMAGMQSPYEEETGVLISINEKLKPATEDRKGCVDENKPILRTVAADWNEEEFCSISPKWLDRNGIQNNVNEHKEPGGSGC